MTIFTITYYSKNEKFDWTDTLQDHVYAKTEEEALKKFDKRHPDRKVRYVSNWVTADY